MSSTYPGIKEVSLKPYFVQFHIDKKLQSFSAASVSPNEILEKSLQNNEKKSPEKRSPSVLMPIPVSKEKAIAAERKISNADQHKIVNFLEFESGLQQPDPWDTPQNDIEELHRVLEGSLKTSPSAEIIVTGPIEQQKKNMITPVTTPNYLMSPGSDAGVNVQNNNPRPPSLPQRPLKPNPPPKPNPPALPPRIPSKARIDDRSQTLMSKGVQEFVAEKAIQIFPDGSIPTLFLFCSLYSNYSTVGAPVEVIRDAIRLYDHLQGDEKPKEFVQSYVKLKEMGFPDSRIMNALIAHDANQGSALSELMQDK